MFLSHVRRAAKIRIYAEVRTGELYAAKEKAKGARSQLNGRNSSGGAMKLPPEHGMTLADLKISKRQSSDWQKLGRDPQAVKRYLRECDDGRGVQRPQGLGLKSLPASTAAAWTRSAPLGATGAAVGAGAGAGATTSGAVSGPVRATCACAGATFTSVRGVLSA